MTINVRFLHGLQGKTRAALVASGLAAAALATLSATGPAATAAEFTTSVRSIDEVADGAMPTMTEIASSSAVLRFVSSVPLACSVVFGTSPEFGSVSTDTDMAGGAHTDHHPVLGGLEPETEYFFRVQGVGADGTIYMGDVESFVTAALSPEEVASARLGASVAAVSSNFGGAGNDQTWGAASAIDGDPNTAWSSWGDGDDAYIELAFPSRIDVGGVSVWSRSMADGTARILTFTLTTDRGEVLGPFELPDADRAYRFPVEVTATSLRLDVVESTGGNVGLIEFAAEVR